MSYSIETFDFEYLGVTYRCEVKPDEDCGLPWVECDGHGIITEWESRDKKPGELILCEDRRSKRFYDLAGTMKIAIRDGWGTDNDAGLSKGQKAYRAVMANYEYLRAFCNDEWGYVWIQVFPLTDDGDELRSKSASLGGIEYGLSNMDEYIRGYAHDLAHEIDYKVTA